MKKNVIENKDSSDFSFNQGIPSDASNWIKSENTNVSVTFVSPRQRRFFTTITTGVLVVGICLFVFAISRFLAPERVAMRAAKKILNAEDEMLMLKSRILVESINEKPVYDNDIQIISLQQIRDSVVPLVKYGLGREGFVIASVRLNLLAPVNVTVYMVENETLTAIASPEIELEELHEHKVKIAGSRMVGRIEVTFFSFPSMNTFINRLDQSQIESVKYTLTSYLQNAKLVAQFEPIEVSSEFLDQVKTILKAFPELSTQLPRNDDLMQPIAISCFKKGSEMMSSHSIVRCSANCHEANTDDVIGDSYFHIDSPICVAAIYRGLLKDSNDSLVEYLVTGKSILFHSGISNKVNSASKVEFKRRFIVKRPGPTWLAVQLVDDLPSATLSPILEEDKVILKINFVLQKLDDSSLSYAMLKSESLGNILKNSLLIKIRHGMRAMNFHAGLIKLENIQNSLDRSGNVDVNLSVFGGYKDNALAMLPYKPWKEQHIQQMTRDLNKNLTGMQLIGIKIEVPEDYLAVLSMTAFTTPSPITKYPDKCRCGDVFFMQDKDFTAKDKILKMYQDIIESFHFDQINMGLGLVLDGHLITDIGQDLPGGVLRRFEEHLNDPEMELHNPLESDLVGLHKESQFLQQGKNKRKKLLIISSASIFDEKSTIDKHIIRILKDQNILVSLTGYSRDEVQLHKFIRHRSSSLPAFDFIRYIHSVDELHRLTPYLIEVIKKYVCEPEPHVCPELLFNISVPIELQSNVSERGYTSSYFLGIPKGKGLKPYEETGGVYYNHMKLKVTDFFRKQEPDFKQSLYRKYACGIQATKPSFAFARIVGGVEASPHSWPWIVSINFLRQSNEKYIYNFWKCGGAIIDKRWVITAAHCFASGNLIKTNYKVVVGIHDQLDYESIRGNVYSIERIVLHPQYNNDRNIFDVALLMLDHDITYSREVAPICLPNPDVIPRTGKQCWIAGWGYTSASDQSARNRLKQGRQIIENPETCQSLYKQLYYDPNYSLCVESLFTMQCKGDSGGPLMCYENEKWVIYGISNFGPRSCKVGGHSGYMMVPSVMTWICCYVELTVCYYVKCIR